MTDRKEIEALAAYMRTLGATVNFVTAADGRIDAVVTRAKNYGFQGYELPPLSFVERVRAIKARGGGINPIEAAVFPLKEDAIKRARKYAEDYIMSVIADMEKGGWDLNVVAPRPEATMSRRQYRPLMQRHNIYARLTKATWSTKRPKDPDTRARCPEYENEFIDEAGESAAVQYDMFVAKLVEKIGTCYGAKLDGSHVWGYSVLTVWKDNAPTERWKTQQIVNVSKLGKVFNQWPTRKLKPETK